ncbi:MAG TPA: hypothetical protein VFW19_16520 [Allosphingosinicella sp.]|nr:hypothetical protein [Allosphingosinicella sp.]
MTALRRLGIFFIACSAACAILTGVGLFMPDEMSAPPSHLHEAWRPELASVHSVDEAAAILPFYIEHQKGSREERIARGIDQLIRDRFLHGISETGFKDNWLDWLSGFAWENLRQPVEPDQILQHRHALCSQQSIVFQALLKRYGIEYASILISWPSDDPLSRGHFAVGARIDGQWRYFDTDIEARAIGVPVSQVIDGSAVARLYPDKPLLAATMRDAAEHGRISMAHVDQFPAAHAALFQEATRWFSAYGWMVLGALGLLCLAPYFLRWRERPRARFDTPALDARGTCAESVGL